ncbi:MAG: peptide chain release factor N(5)-glutamine methyltransferase [Clostridia bacterium]|nr:peptide chain release factor N(5)-glutamine methyltransferase [Clostridia bacterium]MBQ7101527.1 peptide chain release factor N(5)-glutamine methyltransferase [Clostridia bacterium]
MKLNDLRKELTALLEPCSGEDSAFEADCILADLLGCTNSALSLYYDTQADVLTVEKAKTFVRRRLEHEPLQYILGKWEFYGREFYVGDGVLIPRPETELLIDTAFKELTGKTQPVCYDLCSGSGCIGITVAEEISDSRVYMLEKSEMAYGFLEKNIAHNGTHNCKAVIGDMFDLSPFSEKADIILSNPPYIRSDVIPSLQAEVHKEPLMALDGGTDGLMFYKRIADYWSESLKPDGIIAVEIGEDQGVSVSGIFKKKFRDVTVIKDFSGNDRVVVAKDYIN